MGPANDDVEEVDNGNQVTGATSAPQKRERSFEDEEVLDFNLVFLILCFLFLLFSSLLF